MTSPGPEIIIKMYSSLLNVSNDAGSRPAGLILKDIEMFLESEVQDWLKRAHVWKFLGIEVIRTSLNGSENGEIRTRQELVLARPGTPGWSGSKDQQNKTNKFLSVYGAMYAIVN